MPIVPHSQILRVHAAAVVAGLALQRKALLAGLSPSLIAGLQSESNPRAQILCDLDHLNRLGRPAAGPAPLELWLHNAITLSETGGGDVFLRVLALVRATPTVTWTSPPVTVSGVGQSVFICHGRADEIFAKRLDAALRRHGVTASLLAGDSTPGERIHPPMRRGASRSDQVILICSKSSLDSPEVTRRVEETLAREARDGVSYLIPITLDDHVFSDWAPPDPRTAQAVRDRVAADFRGADDDSSKFKEDVALLVNALRGDPSSVAPAESVRSSRSSWEPGSDRAPAWRPPSVPGPSISRDGGASRDRIIPRPPAPSKRARSRAAGYRFASMTLGSIGAVVLVLFALIAWSNDEKSRGETSKKATTPPASAPVATASPPVPTASGPTSGAAHPSQVPDCREPVVVAWGICPEDETPSIQVPDCENKHPLRWLEQGVKELRDAGFKGFGNLGELALETAEMKPGSWPIWVTSRGVRVAYITLGWAPNQPRDRVIRLWERGQSRLLSNPVTLVKDGWCEQREDGTHRHAPTALVR